MTQEEIIQWGFEWQGKPVGLRMPASIPDIIAVKAIASGSYPPDNIHVAVSDTAILITDLREAAGEINTPFEKMTTTYYEELIRTRLPLDNPPNGVDIVV